MDNRGKRQAASIFGGMGFYIALLICVVAAGVVGYYALISSEEQGNNDEGFQPVDQLQPEANLPVAAPEDDPVLPVISDVPVTVKRPVLVPPPEEKEEPAAKPVVSVPENVPVSTSVPVPVTKIVAPLSGETVAVFSADQLAYDHTLGDWRTHDGVDVSASAGTAVVAASAGTVLSVEEDDLLGVTVVIDHHNGYVTTYASLHPETVVLTGDSVNAGDTIGAVGNTSLTESALGAHLHFSVSKDGESVDPALFLK